MFGWIDLIFMRKDPPFDIGYIFATYMLDLVPKSTLVLNDPNSIRSANEKIVALQFKKIYSQNFGYTRDIRAKN